MKKTSVLILLLIIISAYAEPFALIKKDKKLNIEKPLFISQNYYIADLGVEDIKKSDVLKSFTTSGEEELFQITAKSGVLENLEDFEYAMIVKDGTTAVFKGNENLKLQIFNKGYNPVKLRYIKNNPLKTSYTTDRISPKTEFEDMVNAVSQDSVNNYIQWLQDMVTRYCQAPNRRDVAVMIKNKFLEVGADTAVLDSFYLEPYWSFPGTWQYNVIATIEGSENPDEFIMLGGHHDSIVGNVSGTQGQNPMLNAPGADDNGSAVAAALEVCRVIKEANYTPKSSIQLATWAAEEHGLHGSFYHAGTAAATGKNIKLYINNDMIANSTATPGSQYWAGKVYWYEGYENYRDFTMNIMEEYTSLNSSQGSMNSSSSDSHAFFVNGFPVVYFFEYEFSPVYHSYDDTIDNCNIPYATEMVKANVALTLEVDMLPSQVSNLVLADPGTGTEISATWDEVTASNFSHYKVSIGTEEGVFTDTYTTTDNSYTITGLTDETEYFVAVQVVSDDGFEGLMNVQSITIHNIPVAPEDIMSSSNNIDVTLSWTEVNALDLAGYNVYRSQTSGTDYELLNSTIITETTYQDPTANTGGAYFYIVKAVDNDSNESETSEEVKGRIVSLDQGILVVDESRDGNGINWHPMDEDVDEFYNNILTSFAPATNIDVNDLTEDISLPDLAPYSTIIWHAHQISSPSDFYRSIDAIADYLDYGGNMLISIDKPTKAAQMNATYPNTFQAGDFSYDYLKISQVMSDNDARFWVGMPSLSEYHELYVDTEKTDPDLNYHYRRLEGFVPVNTDCETHTYMSNYPQGSPQTVQDGQTVGIEYDGNDFKVVVTSIPLYFIQQDQAKTYVEYVLGDVFGETVGIEDEEGLVIDSPTLLQNYPNPFNPETKISFVLPNGFSGKMKLSIYNSKGEVVKVLANRQFNGGIHSVNFDASSLTSGVYMYTLEGKNSINSKKMLLIK